MKRVGRRGEGKFAPISWDEALDTIATQLRRIIDTYGNESVYFQYGSGSTGGNITQRGTWPRLLNCLGGSLNYYGTYSTAMIQKITPYIYGSNVSSNSIEDAQHARLLVHWGNNPLETRMSGGGELYVNQELRRESGVRTIVIDPRYTDTAAMVADEWIPIRPGTDAALASAIAYVLFSENLQDQEFLDQYVVGFDEAHMPAGAEPGRSYRSYIMGDGYDRVPKTPAWAAPITGVPEAKIVSLAREIAGAKPCAILQGWGPQRQANGEDQASAIMAIAILTGNVGIPGGGTGTREGYYTLKVATFPYLTNPVKTSISMFTWTDAIDHGPQMTATRDGVMGADHLKVPIKCLINVSSNTTINQHADTGATAKILQDESKCEFILVSDHQMTPTAKFADILLPATTNFEESDLVPGGSASEMGWVIYAQQAIQPLFDSRTGYDVCTALAQRLGVADKFTEGRTQQQWVSYLVEQSRKSEPNMPDEATLKQRGVWRQRNPNGYTVGLQAFRADPDKNKLVTPSGKIELYSTQLAKLAETWEFPNPEPGDQIWPIPAYMPTWEGAEAARDNSTYPLQMIGHHYKGRTHSSYANLAWLKEAHPQVAWINPVDAQARGIVNGDEVYVFNGRGRIRTQARVTSRIIPGVISVPQGAWYTPDAQGVDGGGCVNTLTRQKPSALAKGNPQHTNLVQVEKA
jgi:anaerobic dimethyl sulfoxide reductase subunit A